MNGAHKNYVFGMTGAAIIARGCVQPVNYLSLSVTTKEAMPNSVLS